MNADEGLPPDEQFASVLAAWDDALAAGAIPNSPAAGAPDLWDRLERGLACLQRLQGLRPRGRVSGDASSIPIPDPRHPTPDLDVPGSLTGPESSTDFPGEAIASTPGLGRRYTLTRLHATGGIGRVWLAFDGDLGREVALKELRPERSEKLGFADRFLHEARITGQLEHPGIVPVYELTRRPEDGRPFYTMRFIKGRTLTDAIRTHHEKRAAGRADPLERAALLTAFVATCNAVAYAHSRAVIHRDLKGQNVVLGDFGEVIVLDWGFAKVLGGRDESAVAAAVVTTAEAGPGHTVEGQVIGTPAYMAPEQAEGRADRVDHRVDVYGLGAILYELLTGRPPFAGAAVEDVLRQVREVEPPRPRQVWAGVPRPLEAVCLRALAKVPQRRYPSAGDLAREVQRWLADEPVSAYREPAAARLGRWARRHRTLATGLAVLFVSAVIGGVVIREEWARNQVRVQAAEKVADAERKARSEVATSAYLKHVALAQEAVSARQLARADDLLERCEPALRDWEWHYLQRRTHRCLHTLRGHTQVVRCVAYRPDGRQFASAGGEGTIRIWDAMTGQLIRPLPGHPGGVFRVAYRPPDGRYLASAGVDDGAVRVWDTTTGREVFSCAHEHRSVLGVAYSPDGRQLASSSWDKTVRLWDAENGRPVHILVRHTHELGVLAFRPPDGRQLAVAAFDNTVGLWDVATGEAARPFAGVTGFNTIFAFSPDGRHLAAGGGNDRVVSIWDVTDRREVWAARGRAGMLPVVAYSPDGRLLALASADQTVRVWDAATGRAVRTVRGHHARLSGVTFSPDSRQLVTSGDDATIKVWDVTDLETNAGPESVTLGWHPQGVRGLAFSPDGAALASAGTDGAVRIWDATSGGHPHPLLALAPAPLALAAIVSARVVTTGPEVRAFTGHRGPVAGAVFSPDGKRLASAGEDGTILVRDAATGGMLFSVTVPAGPVRSVTFSADGRQLAATSGDKTVTVWDAANGREIRTFHGQGDVIHGVAFRPGAPGEAGSGLWLAAVDAVGTLQVWDAATGRTICTRRARPGNTTERLAETLRAVAPSPAQPRSAGCVAFSSSGRRLAWTGEDFSVAVWDLDALPPCFDSAPDTALEPLTCRGHTGLVTGLVFTPDGKRLVSGGEDGVAKLWDSRTGQEALTLRGHPGIVRSVAFSIDARVLAAAGDDGTITIWDGTPLDTDPGR